MKLWSTPHRSHHNVPVTSSPEQAPAVRSALAEPTVNPPWRWVVALSLVNLGIMSGWFGPIQVLLAEQAREISPEHKEQVLGWVLGVGAFVSTVCNPLFGAFSDRTTLRIGRRLPWILVGAAGGSLSLLVLSVADSVPMMMLGWCGVQAVLERDVRRGDGRRCPTRCPRAVAAWSADSSPSPRPSAWSAGSGSRP